MKRMIILFLCVFCSINIFSKKIGILSEPIHPNMISIHDGTLAVSEGVTFRFYSLKNLKLIRQFGESGEGPGELKLTKSYLSLFPFSKPKILIWRRLL